MTAPDDSVLAPPPASPAAPPPASAAAPRRGPVRRLYDWTLGWAERPGGTWALFGLAFAESSFFPIPPDVLLMALCMGRPRRSFWFALVATVGSVLGGIAGYFIGHSLFEQIGRPILEWYGATATFDRVGELYRQNLVLALGTAGFTPVPYKVFTIAGGAFAVPLLPFVLISVVSRGARFALVGTLIYYFGPPVKSFIDRYFNLLSILFVVLLVGGFAVVRLATH
ncbi:MAG TPA: YqaA family protein [Gemmatimonadaceae bacterium]|jgi:membrane protein YqaA with SNARE-associated domain